MKILNYNCYKTQCSKYGKYAVIQPNEANSLSNIKNTSNRWGFRRNENPELEVSSRSNNEDKAIGFPDFSSAIQKNKTYIAEIVSVPIQNENISITTKTESSNYTKPDSQDETASGYSTERPSILRAEILPLLRFIKAIFLPR